VGGEKFKSLERLFPAVVSGTAKIDSPANSYIRRFLRFGNFRAVLGLWVIEVRIFLERTVVNSTCAWNLIDSGHEQP